MPACVERVERSAPFRAVDRRQHGKCRQHVGHVLARHRTAPWPAQCRRRSPSAGEIGEARVAQRAPADRGAVDADTAGVGQPLVGGAQVGMQCAADRRPCAVAHRVDRIDIRDRHLVGQERFARQGQRLGGERRIRIGIAQRGSQRLDQSLVERRRFAAPPGRRHLQQQMRRILLPRLPAHERIGVVRGQELQVRERHAGQLHRRGKAAQQRRHGRSGTSSNVKLCSASPNSSVRAAISLSGAVEQPHERPE